MTSRVVCAAMLGVVLGVCGLVSIFGGPISAAQEMSTDNPFFVGVRREQNESNEN